MVYLKDATLSKIIQAIFVIAILAFLLVKLVILQEVLDFSALSVMFQ